MPSAPSVRRQGSLVEQLEHATEAESVSAPRAAGLTAAAMVLALEGCGGGGDSGSSAGNPGPPPIPPTPIPPAPAAGPAPPPPRDGISRHRCRGRPLRFAGAVFRQRRGYHRAQEHRLARVAERALRRTGRPDGRRLAQFAGPQRHHGRKALSRARIRRLHDLESAARGPGPDAQAHGTRIVGNVRRVLELLRDRSIRRI